jgi:hypothetical protein
LIRNAECGVPWTKEDVGTLKVHSKSRTPAAEVVNALKRRDGLAGAPSLKIAVYPAMRVFLRPRIRVRQRSAPMTEADADCLRLLPDSGLSSHVSLSGPSSPIGPFLARSKVDAAKGSGNMISD